MNQSKKIYTMLSKMKVRIKIIQEYGHLKEKR